MELHRFFEQWFTGELPRRAEDFARFSVVMPEVSGQPASYLLDAQTDSAMPCHAMPEPIVPARTPILLALYGDDDALRQCVCVFGSLQDFRIITATGSTQTQMQLTAMIDCAHACIDSPGEGGGEPAFQIRIRNVELLQVFAGTPQSYLLTYEEFQNTQVCQALHACVLTILRMSVPL